MKATPVGGAAMLVVIVAGGPVSAAESVESGWWTSAPVALAPDAPEGELLVQGGVGEAEPLAYAGISFTLAEGEAPDTLVLTVSEGSASTPGSTLALCRLGAHASAAAGEPAEDGPTFDCATKVEAAPSEDGTSYEFDVTAFAPEGALDVAVLPAGGTDRVVLTAPGADALRSTGSSTGGSSPGMTASGSTGSTAGGVSSGGTSGGTSTGSGIRAPVRAATPALSAPAPAAPRPAGTGTAAPAPRAAPAVSDASAAAVDGGGGRSAAPFAFAGLAAAAAVLWTVAGQRSGKPAVDDAGENR